MYIASPLQTSCRAIAWRSAIEPAPGAGVTHPFIVSWNLRPSLTTPGTKEV